MKMKMTLAEALDELDIDNDEHWTADGLPRLDTLEEYMGTKPARAAVKAAAPHFSRTNPQLASILDADGEAPETALDDPMDEDTAEPQQVVPAPVSGSEEVAGASPKPLSQQLDEQSHQINLEIEKLKAEQSLINARASQAHTKESKDRDPHAGQKELMRYIRKQNEVRAAKVAERNRVAVMMGQPPTQGGVSVLDRALNSRKPQRGSTRPDFSKRTPLNGGT